MATDIRLCAFNLTADIRMILVGLCHMSSPRHIHYSISDSPEVAPSDVVILNGLDEDTLGAWKSVKSDVPWLTSVLINNDEFADHENTYSIARDNLGVQLLNLLDRIVSSRKTGVPSGMRVALPNSKRKQYNPQSASGDRNLSQAAPAKGAHTRAEGGDVEHTDIASIFSGGPKRALIVDDNASVRKPLREFLEKQQFVCDRASSARQAISLIRGLEYKFDIVFLDIAMPQMDGYKTCKRIKKEKAAASVPVVMLTSKSSTLNRARGKMAGCDAYLTKPVKVSRFKEMLAEKT